MTDKKPYRDIFKATALMGGVQVVQILLRIVRMKVVSVLLGTAGMGINALFNNSLNLIGSITGLGLNLSAVRDISRANGEGNRQRLARVVRSLRSWIWATGLLGALVMLTLAPLLSEWSFGNRDYTWGFVWLSCVMLLKTLADGENSIMRGMQRLHSMAKASTTGAAAGLAVSIPLYYFLGLEGIVPALILSAIVTYLTERRYSRRIPVEKTELSLRERYETGKGMAQLGVMLVLSSFIGTLTVYLTNIFISHFGGVSEVGLYQAGVSLSNQYVGMVFAAMSTDYYPRLSAVSHDDRRLKILVNRQTEIALLIIAPIAVGIILSAPLVIRLLYTAEFTPIIGYLLWMSSGVLFKACSWAMAFTILAKGESGLYFRTELAANSLILLLTIAGYRLGGITGTGIAFCISYLLYSLLIYSVIRKRYRFRPGRRSVRIFGILGGIVTLSLISALLLGYPASYLPNGFLLLAALVFSCRELNRRIGFRELLSKKK